MFGFSGQDDLLCDGVIKQAIKMVSNKNIGILNLNFSQYDHNMKKCLTESFLRKALLIKN